MRERKGDGTGLIIGFILGGIIGAGLALLFAPQKGKLLRNDVKRRTGEWLDEAEDVIEETRGKMTRAAKQISKRIGKP
jgi:gas vesicle protein